LIARGLDVLAGKVQLKAANAWQAAGGSANFCGKIRQSGDVVADDGRRVRELRARQLHTVARVAREANGYGFDFLELLVKVRNRGFYQSAHLLSLKPFRE